MKTVQSSSSALCCLLWSLPIGAFVPAGFSQTSPSGSTSWDLSRTSTKSPHYLAILQAQARDSEEADEQTSENPYQDPNYPDLEFVNYDDPGYEVDQGVGDEFFDPTTTEEKVEAMREERRLRNDEYQFETYFKDIVRGGAEFKGEWTILRTSTFLDDIDDGPGPCPRIKKAAHPVKVVSKAERIEIDVDNSEYRLDNQRILHHESIFRDDESGEPSNEQAMQAATSMSNKYWPDQLSAYDFRGHQGIMCVANAYTICKAFPLTKSNKEHEGPFAEYFAELGILSEELRYRIKLDYSVKDNEKEMETPPLHLRSLTVCRETEGMWPRAENYKSKIQSKTDDALFGPPGAPGGLYDPPLVGSDEQASQYLMLDLEGGATILFPYLMNQDPKTHSDSAGWVTSLDWDTGKIRFQVDRKVHPGSQILGLRTLELSEVQSENAEQYRPKDGGSNMRQ